jgi:hypothetical protein
MTSIWLESLGRNFDVALDLLAAAMRDCTDDLWESSMWEVPADLFGPQPPGADGKPVTDPAARNALAQRRSTPWTTISPVSSVRGRHRPRSRATRIGC